MGTEFDRHKIMFLHQGASSQKCGISRHSVQDFLKFLLGKLDKRRIKEEVAGEQYLKVMKK